MTETLCAIYTNDDPRPIRTFGGWNAEAEGRNVYGALKLILSEHGKPNVTLKLVGELGNILESYTTPKED